MFDAVKVTTEQILRGGHNYEEEWVPVDEAKKIVDNQVKKQLERVPEIIGLCPVHFNCPICEDYRVKIREEIQKLTDQ